MYCQSSWVVQVTVRLLRLQRVKCLFSSSQSRCMTMELRQSRLKWWNQLLKLKRRAEKKPTPVPATPPHPERSTPATMGRWAALPPAGAEQPTPTGMLVYPFSVPFHSLFKKNAPTFIKTHNFRHNSLKINLSSISSSRNLHIKFKL